MKIIALTSQDSAEMETTKAKRTEMTNAENIFIPAPSRLCVPKLSTKVGKRCTANFSTGYVRKDRTGEAMIQVPLRVYSFLQWADFSLSNRWRATWRYIF